MPSEWFFMEDGLPTGPVDEAELRRMIAKGRLMPGSMVWNHELDEWIPAARLDETFLPNQRTTPPPIPYMPATPNRSTATCRHCGQPYKEGLRTCPHCRMGTISLSDAYGTFNLKKGGFGLLDVIPGVRDLPAFAKVILIVVIVGLVMLLVMPVPGGR